jgi:hypothetical protein
LPEIPAVLKRSTSRTWRIAVLSAGIRSPSAQAKGPTVSSQQRRRSGHRLSGRHHPGTASEIISERRAKSNRIGGRNHPGFAGDFARNQQSLDCKILSELTIRKVVSTELVLPITIGFDLIDKDCSVFAAMPAKSPWPSPSTLSRGAMRRP